MPVWARPSSEGQISFYGGISLHSSPQDNSNKLGMSGSSRENAQHCREPSLKSKYSILFVRSCANLPATLASCDFPFHEAYQSFAFKSDPGTVLLRSPSENLIFSALLAYRQ